MVAVIIETVNGYKGTIRSWIAFEFVINELLALNVTFG